MRIAGIIGGLAGIASFGVVVYYDIKLRRGMREFYGRGKRP